jgi:hypothetical protein
MKWKSNFEPELKSGRAAMPLQNSIWKFSSGNGLGIWRSKISRNSSKNPPSTPPDFYGLKKFSKFIKTAGVSVFFFLWGTLARAQEPAAPRSEVALEFGEVAYRSVPAEMLGSDEFSGHGPVMGLTSAKFRAEYGVELGTGADTDGCVPVAAVKITAGYSSFEILVDERYSPGGCEYEAIVEHELKHVRIYRDELAYYGKLIEDELLISSLNMGEVCAGPGAERRAFKEKAKSLLRDDERIGLLFSRFDESVRQKNSELDSEEEYLRVKSLCSDWRGAASLFP